MSGHTSSQITVQEQHHTAPIQTQSHATQQQISQTRTTATPSDPFSEFKPKKRDKPITLVKQDEANCGCFAAGMAIASLIRIPTVAKNTDQAWYTQYAFRTAKSEAETFGSRLAKSIQENAKKELLSSVGEMFDANSLVTAINTVLQAEEYLPAGKAGKYMAKAVPFYTSEQLAGLLTRASAKGVRVLIPYYSQNEAPALMPGGTTVPAEQMSNAHWGVVSCQRIPSVASSASRLAPTSSVYLYEGHKTAIRQRCTIADVARSNLCLGDRMNWAPHITSCFAYDAAVQYGNELLNRIQSVIPCLDDAILNLFLNELVSGNNAFKLDTIQRLIKQHLRTDDKVTLNLAASIHNFFQTYVKFDSPNAEIKGTLFCLQARQAGHPEIFTDSPIPSWLKNRPYNPDENLLENVNLRGQVILIGKKADAPARAPAAPTPPPPTDGT